MPASYRTLDEKMDHTSRFAAIKDISLGGVRIIIPRLVALCGRILIVIHLPGQTPIEAMIAPSWISSAPNAEYFIVGMQFVVLNEKARAAIEHYHSPVIAA